MYFVDDAQVRGHSAGVLTDASGVDGGRFLTIPEWTHRWLSTAPSLGVLTGHHDLGYDASVTAAKDELVNAIATLRVATSQPVVIVSLGVGADVVAEAIRQLATEKPWDLVNVTLDSFGGSEFNDGGFRARFVGLPKFMVPGIGMTLGGPPETTPLPVTVNQFAIQYDGFADFPEYPLNLLADVNAALGYAFYHGKYGEVDLQDPHIVYTYSADGKIVNALIPTRIVPVLQVLVNAHLINQPLAEALDPFVRSLIEPAYDRQEVYPDHPVGFKLLPTPQKFVADVQHGLEGALETGERLGQLVVSTLAGAGSVHLPLPAGPGTVPGSVRKSLGTFGPRNKTSGKSPVTSLGGGPKGASHSGNGVGHAKPHGKTG
jgi:hypothetical protein